MSVKKTGSIKILSVVGTRPNINKEMLVHRELAKRRAHEVLVHTGQHYDYEMSKLFFEECGLPEPDYNLGIHGKTHGETTGKIIRGIERVIEKEAPDVTLVYGDVDSTLAAAIASTKRLVPVAHVEAGPRCKFLYNPEEINRRATDHISQLLFAPTRESERNLLRENIPRERIVFSGDLVWDNLLYVKRKLKLRPRRGDYVLLTLHRAENTNSPVRLKKIFSALLHSREKIVFPVHPRTRKKLEGFGLWRGLQGKNIELLPPQGYFEFVRLLAGANRVATDSGGVRREAYLFAKPVVTVIEPEWEWWPEIVRAGWNRNVGCDEKKIIAAVRGFEPRGARPAFFGDGHAARRIADALCKRRFEY